MPKNNKNVFDIQQEINAINQTYMSRKAMSHTIKKFSKFPIEELLNVKDFYGSFTVNFDNFRGDNFLKFPVFLLFSPDNEKFNRLLKDNVVYLDAFHQSQSLTIKGNDRQISFRDIKEINQNDYLLTMIDNEIFFPIQYFLDEIQTVSDFLKKWKDTEINPIEILAFTEKIKVSNHVPSGKKIDYLLFNDSESTKQKNSGLYYFENLLQSEFKKFDFSFNSVGIENFNIFNKNLQEFKNLIGDIRVFREIKENGYSMIQVLNTEQIIDFALNDEKEILHQMYLLSTEQKINDALIKNKDVNDDNTHSNVFKI